MPSPISHIGHETFWSTPFHTSQSHIRRQARCLKININMIYDLFLYLTSQVKCSSVSTHSNSMYEDCCEDYLVASSLDHYQPDNHCIVLPSKPVVAALPCVWVGGWWEVTTHLWQLFSSHLVSLVIISLSIFIVWTKN